MADSTAQRDNITFNAVISACEKYGQWQQVVFGIAYRILQRTVTQGSWHWAAWPRWPEQCAAPHHQPPRSAPVRRVAMAAATGPPDRNDREHSAIETIVATPRSALALGGNGSWHWPLCPGWLRTQCSRTPSSAALRSTLNARAGLYGSHAESGGDEQQNVMVTSCTLNSRTDWEGYHQAGAIQRFHQRLQERLTMADYTRPFGRYGSEHGAVKHRRLQCHDQRLREASPMTIGSWPLGRSD